MEFFIVEDEKDYISSYTVCLHANTTTEVWTAEDDRDEYMKKFGICKS